MGFQTGMIRRAKIGFRAARTAYPLGLLACGLCIFLIFTRPTSGKSKQISPSRGSDELVSQQKALRSESGRTEVLEWVCIPRHNITKKICNPPLNHLTVYQSKSNHIGPYLGQIVKFTTEKIPQHFNILYNHTAIFNFYFRIFSPVNVYHFIDEYYIPFNHLLDVWKEKRLTKHVVLFYRMPLAKKCINNDFPSFFLSLLPETDATKDYGYNYHAHPGNVCFRYGIFSDGLHSNYSMSAIKKLKQHYGVGQNLCRENEVVLSERKRSRIWINIKSVRDALVKAGYVNTSIVDFGKISLLKQLQCSHCMKVIIAPHSAALQWGYFMQENSTVIEIAWPKFGWPYRYSTTDSPLFGHVPINFVQFETRDVQNMMKSIAKQRRNPNVIPMLKNASVEPLISSKKYDQILPLRLGKHCNFKVDPNEIVKVMKQALPLGNTQ